VSTLFLVFIGNFKARVRFNGIMPFSSIFLTVGPDLGARPYCCVVAEFYSPFLSWGSVSTSHESVE